MKIHHDIQQGSAAWHRLRNLNFTASNLGPFALEPVKITLTVDEIKAELDARGIAYKGITKRDDLLAKLPGKEAYAKLSSGARTAIIAQIKSERMQAIRDRIAAANESGEPLQMSAEEDILYAREEELAAKEEKQFGFNIPVKYGKMLEPFARAYYQKVTGFKVTEVGFIEHGDGTSGFGCSPDGLVYGKCQMCEGRGRIGGITWSDPGGTDEECPECEGLLIAPTQGVEIKCPIPETHIEWLLDGKLPDDHKLQVHACMAVTGFDRWDFLSYCPGESPLLVTVHRSEFTEQLESGLKTLVAEKAKMKRVLADKWEAAYMQKAYTEGGGHE